MHEADAADAPKPSLAQRSEALSARLEALDAAGVHLVDPRQVFVGPEVDLGRIRPGAVLYPGARLQGARCYVGPGAQVGHEGPATLVNAIFGRDARIASGFCDSAVLLAGASLGANAHVRGGTLLEEQASTAHSVGLKHTILLAFVTLGSVINFCDVLMAGGSSRQDHSEVGSGFIHFNFTPWGDRGDKATPSLVGDVPRGVFYRQRRIFLGGAGGMIGPRSVGFGAVAAAGQVVRHDIDEDRLVLRTPPRMDRRLGARRLDGGARGAKNVEYIASLVALRCFYRELRVKRARPDERPVIEGAIETLGHAIDERCMRLGAFLQERKRKTPMLELDPAIARQVPASLLVDPSDARSHLEFVQALDDAAVQAGQEWLQAVVQAVVDSARPIDSV